MVRKQNIQYTLVIKFHMYRGTFAIAFFFGGGGDVSLSVGAEDEYAQLQRLESVNVKKYICIKIRILVVIVSYLA